MSNVIQRSANGTTLATLLQRQKSAIEAALPRHLSADRMLRIALTEIRKNPDLASCEPMSFLGSVVQAAQLGLEPGSALGHAYLVPFFNRQTERREVQLIVGYRGMLDLARRSGQIVSLSVHAVLEGDEFEFELGLEEKLKHAPAKERVSKDRRLTAVYAIARLKDGGHQLEVMTREEVEAIRKRSKSSESGPWKTDFDEMAKKTVIRRLFKYLPVSVEIQRAVALDEAASVGEAQRNDLLLEDFEAEGTPALTGPDRISGLNQKFGDLGPKQEEGKK
jgi:recombination protein RecT